MLHGVRHLLTPGTPSYAVLKLGAMAAVVGLQLVARRRGRRQDEVEPERAITPRAPHRRSKKRRGRRRRR